MTPNMTPKQLATNMALIAMADMDNEEQAVAAVNLTINTIKGLVEHMANQFEIAGCSPQAILNSYRDAFEQALETIGVTNVEETSDDEILDDPVNDEEETDENDVPIIASSLDSAAMSLKELAMQSIRNKGKFIPLDDIKMPEEDEDDTNTNGETAAHPRNKPVLEKAKRRNVMGNLGS